MNQQRAKFFDTKTGRELSQREAFDRNGMLRDRVSMRVPMTMRDSVAPRNAITDGRTDDPMALHRPGFRVPVVNDRRSVRDAYSAYERQACNRWKCQDDETLCPDCNGEGYDAYGTVCPTCGGDGIMPEDRWQGHWYQPVILPDAH